MLSLQGLFACIGIVFSFYVMNRLLNTTKVPLNFPLALFIWRLTDATGFVGLFFAWIPMLILSTLAGKWLGFLPLAVIPAYFGFLLKRLIADARKGV